MWSQTFSLSLEQFFKCNAILFFLILFLNQIATYLLIYNDDSYVLESFQALRTMVIRVVEFSSEGYKMMPNFWRLAHQFSKFNNFLFVCWFLGIFSNFVSPLENSTTRITILRTEVKWISLYYFFFKWTLGMTSLLKPRHQIGSLFFLNYCWMNS